VNEAFLTLYVDAENEADRVEHLMHECVLQAFIALGLIQQDQLFFKVTQAERFSPCHLLMRHKFDGKSQVENFDRLRFSMS